MVFCGKPSKGCKSCRQRRIKCDQHPDGCGQCTRRSIQCSGYRNQLDLQFRDQSDEIARKARIKHQTNEENLQQRRVKSIVDESTHIVVNESSASPEQDIILRPRQFYNEVTTEVFIINAQVCTPRLEILDSYSGSERTRVVQCLNYYVKFCGPNYIWREEVITTGSIHGFAQDFIQISLVEPAFLEIILAICQADFDLRGQSDGPPSGQVLRHHSQALRLLRQKLSSTSTLKDEIVFATVIAMMVFHMTMGDWKSYGIHLRYLRQAVLSIGGVEALGWQGWLAYSYTWAELRWANHMAHRALMNKSKTHINNQLDYSKQLISNDMSFWISKIPVGFHHVVRSNSLCANVCEFLGEVSDWTRCCKALNTSVVDLGELNKQGLVLAERCARIICSCNLSRVDCLVCIAVMAYIISHIEGPAGHSRGLEDLTANIDLVDLEYLDEECRIWVATAIAAAIDTFPKTLPNRWTLLDEVMKSETTDQAWPDITNVFQKFFWDERHAQRWKQCWKTAIRRKYTG